ncbi:MAG: hypothetical protein V4436_02045 [Patescibacteria group bacterium]
MKIAKKYPPNIEDIRAVLTPSKGTVFTYGDTVYAPDLEEDEMPEHLAVHENVHGRQQKDPEKWWNQYLMDEKFRLEQELEAYGEQWAFINQQRIKNPIKKLILFSLARDLSGPLYGNMLSHGEAESKIRNAAKTI